MTQSAASTLRNAKRRGGFPSGRLRFSARPGVTLVELLVAMLILTIVCISWLQIIGIQSARKEARRREAVERLVGMMDAYMYIAHKGLTPISVGGLEMKNKGHVISFDHVGTNTVFRVFEDDSPIGYQLCIENFESIPESSRFGENWGTAAYWLVGRLYESSGNVSEVGRPFFSLPVRLWR